MIYPSLVRPCQIDKNGLECKHSILVFINLAGVLNGYKKNNIAFHLFFLYNRL